MRAIQGATLCTIIVLAAPAGLAAVRHIPLAPPETRISYTVFALGVVPISAVFDRFAGTVTQDPAHPAACHIDISIDVGSLRMNDPDRRRDALGADMLDVAHFPNMRFVGTCQTKSIAGWLTLHGVTRAVSLAMHRAGAQVICAGSLARRDFGITGMSDTVAPRVRIGLSVHLPP